MPEPTKTVTVNSGTEISESDHKVDLSEPADTTVAEPAGADAGNEDDDQSDDDGGDGFDTGHVDLGEDTPETEADEDTDEDDADTEPEPETPATDPDKAKTEAELRAKYEAEFMEKYKPNEQKSENIRLHKENQELARKAQMSTGDFLIEEKRNEIYVSFFDSHQDVLPPTAKEKLLEFQRTGDESIVLGDPNLSRLNRSLEKILQANPENPLVDLPDRLEAALAISHRAEMMEAAKKQAVAHTELNRRQRDRTAEAGMSSSATPATQKKHSEAAQKVADIWGVQL